MKETRNVYILDLRRDQATESRFLLDRCITLLHNEDKIQTVSTFALSNLLQFLVKTQVI